MLDFSAQRLQLNAFSALPSNLIDGPKIGPLSGRFSRWIFWRTETHRAQRLDQPSAFQSHLARPRAFQILGRSPRSQNAEQSCARPVLRRNDVVEQAHARRMPAAERPAPARRATFPTSGSTGVACHFFISDVNSAYNALRGIAQYFSKDRSLELNRVSIKRANVANEKRHAISQARIGPAPRQLFRNGSARNIDFQHADTRGSARSCAPAQCGYFNALPSHLLSSDRIGSEKFVKLRIAKFVSTEGKDIPDEVHNLCQNGASKSKTSIPARKSVRSPSDAAPPGVFHIATSNVVVECEEPFRRSTATGSGACSSRICTPMRRPHPLRNRHVGALAPDVPAATARSFPTFTAGSRRCCAIATAPDQLQSRRAVP